jgi:uroporphyrinogen decarboxylase
LGFDLVAVGFNAPKGYRSKKVSEGVYQNEWGVLSRSGEGMSWYLDGTIKSREALEEFTPPDPHAEGRTRNLEWTFRRYGERVVVAPPVSGPFTHSWGMMGFSSFVKALYSDPGMVRALLKIVTDHNITMGNMAIDLGAEYLWISDDFGGTKGPMISPRHFHDFILPCLRRMVRSFKGRGAGVLLHCDGNVMPIMDDIVSTGINAFHPMERKSNMDIAVMKREYGDKLTLIGNLEASHLITMGSYEQIDKQMRECFQIGAPGGGYIFASDHSIHPAITAEKARFVYRRASKYRSYPAGHIS